MTSFGPDRARCAVFTYKEGALSALAHDLELTVERFRIELSDALAIDARFDAASLVVRSALRDGRPEKSLSATDHRKIEAAIRDEVLESARYPEIRYAAPAATASEGGYVLSGELTMHGQRRPLTVRTRRDGQDQVAELSLHQPDFGIRPYRAMLGALRIRPDVRVRISLPWPLP